MLDDLKAHHQVILSARLRMTNVFDAALYVAVRVHTVGGFDAFFGIVDPYDLFDAGLFRHQHVVKPAAATDIQYFSRQHQAEQAVNFEPARSEEHTSEL